MKTILRQTIALLNMRERRKLGLLTLLNAFISLADIASLALLLLIIHIYTQPGSIHLLPPRLFDAGSALPILLLAGLFFIKNVAAYFIFEKQTHFIYQVANRISRANLMQYINGSHRDYVQVDASVHAQRIQHQPVEFSIHVLSGLQQIFTEMVLATIATMAILLFNAKLALLLVLILAPPVILASWLTKRKLTSAKTEVKAASEKAAQYLNEALSGYVESNIYARQDFFANRFARYQKQLTAHLSNLQIAQWIPGRFMEVFAMFGLAIFILINKYSNSAATTSIINLGAFMAAAYKIIPGIVKISNLRAQVKHYAFTLEGMAIEQPAYSPNNDAEKPAGINAISFEHISFSHAESSILQDFDLHIEQGDFIAIVAPSGGGKTTLIHLLMGFLAPDSGRIKVNNIPVDEQDLKKLWLHIGYVKQQNFLVHDSIERNITLEEEVQYPARLAEVISSTGLQTLVDAYPEKMEKIISHSGKNISGGQRQRIAIARALYKDAPIIILDEPFSELDAEAEEKLMRYFQDLTRQGKIVILITHNRSNSIFCNKTVFLNER